MFLNQTSLSALGVAGGGETLQLIGLLSTNISAFGIGVRRRIETAAGVSSNIIANITLSAALPDMKARFQEITFRDSSCFINTYKYIIL